MVLGSDHLADLVGARAGSVAPPDPATSAARLRCTARGSAATGTFRPCDLSGDRGPCALPVLLRARFSHTDNGIVSGLPNHRARIRIAGWRALLVGVAFTGVAWVLWRWEHPISIQDSALVQAALGISAIGFMVWLREPLVALAGRIRPQLAWLTRRTLTIYLWGWPCTALAKMAVDKVGLTGWTSMGVRLPDRVGAGCRCPGLRTNRGHSRPPQNRRPGPRGSARARAHPSKSRVLVSEH